MATEQKQRNEKDARKICRVRRSRRGNGFTGRFPQIARACEKLPPDTLIDGEVIVVDENGRCAFNALQHSRPKSKSDGMVSADARETNIAITGALRLNCLNETQRVLL